jgi:hypothetical protein
VLAIRRTLSHNRDELKNSEQRRRASDAQALSHSTTGEADFAPALPASQTPRRHKARFEALLFRAAPTPPFRTRLSAHIAPRRRERSGRISARM